ncbi:PilW family protein [Piscinibacter sp.]|uniref:PilW family protein n=1 Tax=Piscinibacter sp. TaxID=1903157 RepID=UPI002BA2A49D|nr:PilW family protein [Albitalea sp.]HUG23255.1 PilW family protein [Albitalea sp.]
MTTIRHAHRGVTLVELMVGLAIGLIVSLAASALYLATNETARASKALGDINETGKLALDTIGRELQKAGFYPAQYPSNTATPNLMGAFFNGKDVAKPAFSSGLFGCDGAMYDPDTKACAATVEGAPDGIVVNYFATPEFGASALLGNSNDCNRQPVANDPDNAARALAGMPLFVSNRYGLRNTEYDAADGNHVTTRSLACHGNGADAADDHQPHYQGIEDMTIRYGIYSTTASQTPDLFLTATEVTAAGNVGDLTPWQRVTAVKICMLVRSLENARTEDKTGSERTYRDCRGADIKPASGDKFVYKRFERVYAIRNNLTGTL